eukprot:scaffold173249_cov57-Cyclotella_meneghiniana.AAC.3
MRRLLSIDGHGAARFREEIDRRWPWLKCQVDRPSGAGAITARTTPRKLEGRLEKAERPHLQRIIQKSDSAQQGKNTEPHTKFTLYDSTDRTIVR